MVEIKFSQFFDREGVIAKVKDGTKSVLSKAGAFVRTRARRSIRPAPKGKGAKKYKAVPGKPPRSHVGLLKQLIFFGYDAESQSVVVGPQLLNGRSRTNPTPSLLEFGGTGEVDGKTANYHAFPYMAPALEAERPNFPDLFANSVK